MSRADSQHETCAFLILSSSAMLRLLRHLLTSGISARLTLLCIHFSFMFISTNEPPLISTLLFGLQVVVGGALDAVVCR